MRLLWFPKLAKRFGSPALQRNSVSDGAILHVSGSSHPASFHDFPSDQPAPLRRGMHILRRDAGDQVRQSVSHLSNRLEQHPVGRSNESTSSPSPDLRPSTSCWGRRTARLFPHLWMVPVMGDRVTQPRSRVNLHTRTRRLSSRSGMSILTDTARSARFEQGSIVISMASGAHMRFPIAENPRLAGGTASQLNNIELPLFGLHWPESDENILFHGLAQGDHGQARTSR